MKKNKSTNPDIPKVDFESQMDQILKDVEVRRSNEKKVKKMESLLDSDDQNSENSVSHHRANLNNSKSIRSQFQND